MDDYGLTWAKSAVSLGVLNNYRRYQYDLVGDFIGTDILEVGSGDRSFTRQIAGNKKYERIVSIEPSPALLGSYKDKFRFPGNVGFYHFDIFGLAPENFGLFDTVFFIHVLEHIKEDRAALDHAYSLLKPRGRVIIEVPALPNLFSVHDKMLGHYRRYNKRTLTAIIDRKKFKVHKLWYQDPAGVLGALYFFKFRKIGPWSCEGEELLKKEGKIYDRYIIPFERYLERFIRFPFGLSLTAVVEKK